MAGDLATMASKYNPVVVLARMPSRLTSHAGRTGDASFVDGGASFCISSTVNETSSSISSTENAGYTRCTEETGYTTSSTEGTGYTTTSTEKMGYTAPSTEKTGYTAPSTEETGYTTSSIKEVGTATSSTKETRYITFSPTSGDILSSTSSEIAEIDSDDKEINSTKSSGAREHNRYAVHTTDNNIPAKVQSSCNKPLPQYGHIKLKELRVSSVKLDLSCVLKNSQKDATSGSSNDQPDRVLGAPALPLNLISNQSLNSGSISPRSVSDSAASASIKSARFPRLRGRVDPDTSTGSSVETTESSYSVVRNQSPNAATNAYRRRADASVSKAVHCPGADGANNHVNLASPNSGGRRQEATHIPFCSSFSCGVGSSYEPSDSAAPLTSVSHSPRCLATAGQNCSTDTHRAHNSMLRKSPANLNGLSIPVDNSNQSINVCPGKTTSNVSSFTQALVTPTVDSSALRAEVVLPQSDTASICHSTSHGESPISSHILHMNVVNTSPKMNQRRSSNNRNTPPASRGFKEKGVEVRDLLKSCSLKSCDTRAPSQPFTGVKRACAAASRVTTSNDHSNATIPWKMVEPASDHNTNKKILNKASIGTPHARNTGTKTNEHEPNTFLSVACGGDADATRCPRLFRSRYCKREAHALNAHHSKPPNSDWSMHVACNSDGFRTLVSDSSCPGSQGPSRWPVHDVRSDLVYSPTKCGPLRETVSEPSCGPEEVLHSSVLNENSAVSKTSGLPVCPKLRRALDTVYTLENGVLVPVDRSDVTPIMEPILGPGKRERNILGQSFMLVLDADEEAVEGDYKSVQESGGGGFLLPGTDSTDADTRHHDSVQTRVLRAPVASHCGRSSTCESREECSQTRCLETQGTVKGAECCHSDHVERCSQIKNQGSVDARCPDGVGMEAISESTASLQRLCHHSSPTADGDCQSDIEMENFNPNSTVSAAKKFEEPNSLSTELVKVSDRLHNSADMHEDIRSPSTDISSQLTSTDISSQLSSTDSGHTDASQRTSTPSDARSVDIGSPARATGNIPEDFDHHSPSDAKRHVVRSHRVPDARALDGERKKVTRSLRSTSRHEKLTRNLPQGAAKICGAEKLVKNTRNPFCLGQNEHSNLSHENAVASSGAASEEHSLIPGNEIATQRAVVVRPDKTRHKQRHLREVPTLKRSPIPGVAEAAAEKGSFVLSGNSQFGRVNCFVQQSSSEGPGHSGILEGRSRSQKCVIAPQNDVSKGITNTEVVKSAHTSKRNAGVGHCKPAVTPKLASSNSSKTDALTRRDPSTTKIGSLGEKESVCQLQESSAKRPKLDAQDENQATETSQRPSNLQISNSCQREAVQQGHYSSITDVARKIEKVVSSCSFGNPILSCSLCPFQCPHALLLARHLLSHRTSAPAPACAEGSPLGAGDDGVSSENKCSAFLMCQGNTGRDPSTKTQGSSGEDKKFCSASTKSQGSSREVERFCFSTKSQGSRGEDRCSPSAEMPDRDLLVQEKIATDGTADAIKDARRDEQAAGFRSAVMEVSARTTAGSTRHSAGDTREGVASSSPSGSGPSYPTRDVRRGTRVKTYMSARRAHHHSHYRKRAEAVQNLGEREVLSKHRGTPLEKCSEVVPTALTSVRAPLLENNLPGSISPVGVPSEKGTEFSRSFLPKEPSLTMGEELPGSCSSVEVTRQISAGETLASDTAAKYQEGLNNSTMAFKENNKPHLLVADDRPKVSPGHDGDPKARDAGKNTVGVVTPSGGRKRPKGKLQCSFCPYSCRLEHRMAQHESRHCTASVFTCTECYFRASSEVVYRSHLLRHQLRPHRQPRHKVHMVSRRPQKVDVVRKNLASISLLKTKNGSHRPPKVNICRKNLDPVSVLKTKNLSEFSSSSENNKR